MSELRQQILDTVRSHTESAKAGFEAGEAHATRLLRGEYAATDQAIAATRAENLVLGAKLGKALNALKEIYDECVDRYDGAPDAGPHAIWIGRLMQIIERVPGVNP